MWFPPIGLYMLMYNNFFFACSLTEFKCPKSTHAFIPIVLLQSHQEISPEPPFSVDANGPVMACHSFRATAVGRSCDCHKVVGRGYLLLKPAPIPPHYFYLFIFFLPVTHPLLPVYWKPSVALYWMFSFWFGMSWAGFRLSGFCLLQYYIGAWCLCSGLIIYYLMCALLNFKWMFASFHGHILTHLWYLNAFRLSALFVFTDLQNV